MSVVLKHQQCSAGWKQSYNVNLILGKTASRAVEMTWQLRAFVGRAAVVNPFNTSVLEAEAVSCLSPSTWEAETSISLGV